MALATQLLASGRGVAGSAFFVDGMSSAVDPTFISDRSFRHAENTLHRGGVVRTRPGYRQIFTLERGALQGGFYFRPISGEGHAVVSVAGKIYATQYPFASLAEIPNIQFYPYALQVHATSAIQSAQKNPDGTISAVEPRRVMIFQDGGFTRAAYWDGSSSGHIDPTVVVDGSGNVLTAGTPLGSSVVWSGDRLWVARGNKLFAGDISDPFSFTENEYAGEGGFFAFDDDITAMAEVPSLTDPVLLVFTKSRTWQILSSIRARSTWVDTPKFKSTLFPNIGCVSSRSVVAHQGMLWWMSASGLVNLNSAQQAKISSRLPVLDMSMSVSKTNVWSDLSGSALGAYENFLVCSMPYASRYNTHTWVLDSAVNDESSESWAGVWTGTQPVEWIGGQFGGAPRILYCSMDADRQNRLWEAFIPDRRDNGHPIECFVETKTHVDFSPKATGLDLKRFVFAEVSLGDLMGDVDLSVYWAGPKGKYKKLADYTLVATPGVFDATVLLSADSTVVSSYRSQQRVLRNPELKLDPFSTCTARGVESTRDDWLDIGFSLLIRWTGRASLRSYRIFADPEQESGTGEAATIETGPKILTGAICS